MASDDSLKARVQALSDAIVNEALVASDYTPIFDSFCTRLADAGVPIFRVHIATATLHPMADGMSLTWRREKGVIPRLYEHGSTRQEDWLKSPLKAMLDAGASNTRIHGTDIAEARTRYPLIEDLASEGMTDYYGLVKLFSDDDTAIERRDGLIASFSTDHSEGFSQAHIDAIERLMPRFCLVSKLANRETIFSNVLDAYLGPDAGRHVREGQIALGSGDLIDAVIWFCDLRGSVTLAETLGHQGFMDLLNDYFAALAGSVIDGGGQVLRFIGDAALAIFPIADDGLAEEEAKQLALKAARSATASAAEINAQRQKDGLQPFEFGIGLHIGRIMYGNIGVPSRVEYSVIGPAANEAARIESLCKTIGETVLVSARFRDGMDGSWRDLGHHPIKGSTEMHLFAPDD